MAIAKVILVVQLVSAILLMAAILVSSRGATLGEAFGGSGALFGTRRGPEKVLYSLTIILAILFIGLSFAALLV